MDFKSLAKQIPSYKKTILAALTLVGFAVIPIKANAGLINCTSSFGTDNATFSCLNNTGLITYDTTSVDSRFYGLDMSLQTLGDVPLTAYSSGDFIGTTAFSLPTLPVIDDPLNVPEPGSIALIAVGLLGLGYTAKKRKN